MADRLSHISAFEPTKLRAALGRSAVRHDRSLSAEIRTAISARTSDPSGAMPSTREAVRLARPRAVAGRDNCGQYPARGDR